LGTLTQTRNQSQFSSSLLRNLSPELRAKVERAGLIAYLVFECLNLSEGLARDLEHHYNFSASDFSRYHVKSIPKDSANAVIAHACFDRFGETILNASNLFYAFDRSSGPCYCPEWSDHCHCHLKTWRLDLSAKLSSRGFLLPLRDRRYGFFTDLLVFRHVRDERPFRLNVRSDREVAA
jgi:hypothetical protein